jgi:branched-chain amino acid transport system ATP-binding protein
MGMLSVESVSRQFGGLQALKNVSFSISPGETVGVIGPNGAGKTTLFNIISGLLAPDKGRIYFEDKDITQFKPHQISKQGLIRTFQIVRPFPKMRVAENVLVAALNRINQALEAKEKVNEVLEFVDLSKKAHLFAEDLNISELKRLELAKALAAQPKLLLLDEVMAGLNSVEQDFMIGLVNKVMKTGISILIIEHVMKAIMSLSHRVIVLNYGSKITEGTPREISTNREVIEAYLGEEI